MSFHDSQVYSILNNKCPHCHQGDFWKTGNHYDLKNFAQMNERCSVCNEDFRKEPGYYFGASYVSYGLTVAFGVFSYIIFGWLLGMDTVPFLLTFSTLLIVLLPLFYRFARLIWIHMFVKYKKL
jgi:uncharacterized protein (DUF983 family)